MARKRHKPDEIVAKLRQAEVLTAQGQSVAEVKTITVTETYFRWRSEYGGLKRDRVKRLKDLELENARPRRAVSDACNCLLGPARAPSGLNRPKIC